MKILIFSTAILFILSGCSNSGAPPSNGAANVSNPLSANSAAANANNAAMSNSSAMQPYSGMQNVNPNAFNATKDNLKVSNVAPKRDELPYGQRYAPDNSIISSGSRGKDFFEARTFKDHPKLAKIEKIMDGVTTKYTVYLKNGKAVDAPADKMGNFAAMSPENVLDAVGLLPKPKNAATPDPNKKNEKQP